jgi:hypothetical protein
MYPSDIFSRMYAGEKNTKLYPKKEEAPSEVDDILQTNLFNVMLNRRSQRNRTLRWRLLMPNWRPTRSASRQSGSV